MKVFKIRDLSIIDIGNKYMVIAVDAFGGIGSKRYDVLKVSINQWATAILRVPIMEILATGAEPFLLIDALSVEYKPTGEEVVAIIKKELMRIGYPDISLNGSTEDNIPTYASGAGVVVLGEIEKRKFRPGSSQKKDKIFVIGIPKSGPKDVVDIENDSEIPDILDLIFLRNFSNIHDILPVGSCGIAHEVIEIAKSAGLDFREERFLSLDLHKSAGPATCFLVSGPEDITEHLKKLSVPVTVIGELL